MPSLYVVATMVAAMTTAFVASPVEAATLPRFGVQNLTHSLQVTRSKRSLLPDILGTLERPYQKYSIPMPEHRLLARAENDLQKRAQEESASVTTTPTSVDVEYIVPLTIQGQTFRMLLDTGSSDTWVFSDLMPAAQQESHTIFNTGSAKQVSGMTFGASYGDSSTANGYVYRSPVQLGSVTVTGFAVEAAASASAGFVDSPIDGLMGMAFPKLNTVSPKPVLGIFPRTRAHLAAPLFAVALKHAAPGTLDLGFIDPSAYTGSIAYTAVSKYTSGQLLYWEFPLSQYAIGSTAYSVSSFSAIVDTGTTLLYLPPAIVQPFYAQVSGAAYDSGWGAYVFPCASAVPNLGLFVAGQQLTVPAANINWQQINATTCMGGLQSNAGMPFAILGDVFLKDLYAVFEREAGSAPRMGFAQQA